VPNPAHPLPGLGADESARRTWAQVVNDCLYPDGPFCPDPEMKGLRCRAAAHVLRRLPAGPYELLKGAARSFCWFIPYPEARGLVAPSFSTVYPQNRRGGPVRPRPYTRVVFLPPSLERTPWEAVAVTAHELAHVILGHGVFSAEAEYDRDEEEVYQSLSAWGFGREAEKSRQVCRWRADDWDSEPAPPNEDSTQL
jgi:hypothetical protein